MLNESPDHPLINRPLYGTYPIGSTYKPFVGLAALELGKRRATDRISDPGYYEFGGQKFRNAGGAAYGMTDMHKAIVVSSDTYFYSLGPEIGVNALHDFTKQFGFGQITGIDLEGEKRGVLPSTDWKRSAYKERNASAGTRARPSRSPWARATTRSRCCSWRRARRHWPTTACTAVRTWCTRCAIRARAGQAHRFGARLSHPLKQANVDVIKNAMADVVRAGTARRAFANAPYQAAGKTGTAQVFSLRGARYRASAIDERLRDHALFMGFAPLEHPRIAVALIVENAGWGASVAAPVARKVFDYWLAKERRDKIVRPDRADPLASVESIASDVVRKP